MADRGLQVQPRDATLRFLRGVVLMDMRRDDDAVAQFTQLTHEYPELPEPFNNLAFSTCVPAAWKRHACRCTVPCSTTLAIRPPG